MRKDELAEIYMSHPRVMGKIDSVYSNIMAGIIGLAEDGHVPPYGVEVEKSKDKKLDWYACGIVTARLRLEGYKVEVEEKRKYWEMVIS